MDEFTLFRTGTLINHTFTKVTLSLDEIKDKHPNRKDLIDSMTETKNELQEISLVFRTLEKEYRAALQNAYRLELVNLDLKRKIDNLEMDIKARDL